MQASAVLAAQADPDTARLDAELLVTYVTGLSRTALFTHPETVLSEAQSLQLDTLLQRRCQQEPMAYITGIREFWSLPLSVQAGTLVPRPETELLVEKALELLCDDNEGCIIELGTGTGAIALALAQEISNRQIIAVERHAAALHIAMDNVQAFGQNRVQLMQGNWLDAIGDGKAAMIISNPPYLANDDAHLHSLRHEPISALVSGITGLEDLQNIIMGTRRVGHNGTILLLEHGYQQGCAVRSLMESYTYASIGTAQDLAGLDRISFGYVTDTLT